MAEDVKTLQGVTWASVTTVQGTVPNDLSTIQGVDVTGGGNVPPVAGYEAWWAADNITGLVNNDPVSSWDDLSGNSHDATQGTGGLQPVYKTGIINGLPVVRFDGTAILNMANFTDSSNWTVFAVFNRTGRDAQYNVVISLSQAGGASESFATIAEFSFWVGQWGVYTGMDNPANSGSNSTFGYYSVVKSGTSLSFFKNGSTDGSATASTGVFSESHIGKDEYGSGLAGDIAEIILYDSALSSGDRALVEGYLAAKYAI